MPYLQAWLPQGEAMKRSPAQARAQPQEPAAGTRGRPYGGTAHRPALPGLLRPARPPAAAALLPPRPCPGLQGVAL